MAEHKLASLLEHFLTLFCAHVYCSHHERHQGKFNLHEAFFHQLPCALFEPEWLFPNINLSLVVAKEATNCIRLKRHFKMEKQIPF